MNVKVLKSVLAYVDGGKGSEKVIETAVAIGLAFSAYVEVLHVQRPAGPAMPCIIDGGSLIAAAEIYDVITREEAGRTEYAISLFKKYCVDPGLNVVGTDWVENVGDHKAGFSWNLVTGHGSRELGYRGRLFDLTIMARVEEQEGGVDSSLLEAALFDTGRLVMISSDEAVRPAGARISVAWDGSREAARSVGMSMSFLHSAATVRVITVGNAADCGGADELGRYLSRHGVRNECVSLRSNGDTIARNLIEDARKYGTGLLVMGAYGHHALGEYLFGGVTREILQAGSLPLLLAH